MWHVVFGRDKENLENLSADWGGNGEGKKE